jgi:tetratricopeptide (TPR) repeat protein
MKKDFLPMGAALLIMASLVASSALAQESLIGLEASEQAPAVTLVVLQGLPGSNEILVGSYQDGLEKASAALTRRPQYDKRQVQANICAAQVKLDQIEAANYSCEAALDSRPIYQSTATPRKLLAIAYVNHGVVHFTQGDYATAEHEFRRASSLYPALREAQSNLVVTQEVMGKPRIEVGETL